VLVRPRTLPNEPLVQLLLFHSSLPIVLVQLLLLQSSLQIVLGQLSLLHPSMRPETLLHAPVAKLWPQQLAPVVAPI